LYCLLVPTPTGEKKRLKHEKMEAKRAARAAARGFDLPWVNRQLEEFVLRQGDMQVNAGNLLRFDQGGPALGRVNRQLEGPVSALEL